MRSDASWDLDAAYGANPSQQQRGLPREDGAGHGLSPRDDPENGAFIAMHASYTRKLRYVALVSRCSRHVLLFTSSSVLGAGDGVLLHECSMKLSRAAPAPKLSPPVLSAIPLPTSLNKSKNGAPAAQGLVDEFAPPGLEAAIQGRVQLLHNCHVPVPGLSVQGQGLDVPLANCEEHEGGT